MEKQMSKRLKLGLIVAILAIVAVIATVWALLFIQQHFALLRKTSHFARLCFRRL